MKVVQVVPGVGNESSGPSYSVPAFCSGIQHAGCDVSLHVLDPRPARNFDFDVISYRQQAFPHPRLGRSPKMLRGLRRACADADIIHSNSIWMFPNVYCDWARKDSRCKLVMQPRGTLSAWALSNSKWVKRLFGCLFQYRVLRHVDMWVATANSEYEDIRRLGYRQPVCILPNGINLPDGAVVRAHKVGMPERRIMYFLSRLHPTKNVELLLNVWSKLESRFPDWDLAIVGPDRNNSYADQMKELTRTLGCQRVVFKGELKGDEKLKFAAQGECLVLPTHSENFGMVVAEALAAGTAVICSHGAPWEGLNTERCGWWVRATEAAFERAMSEAMDLPREELQSMGARGREWMRRDFAWDAIGAKMKIAYEWLVHGGKCPNFIKV